MIRELGRSATSWDEPPGRGTRRPLGGLLESVGQIGAGHPMGPCRVCGFRGVRTDEVVDRERLLLAECPRCDHRWTAAGGDAMPSASPARVPSPSGAHGPGPTPEPWLDVA